MTQDELSEVVRAVSLSEEAVTDLRLIEDDKAGLLAIGLYHAGKEGTSVLLVHLPSGGKPVRMRIGGDHQIALAQMLGVALDTVEE